MQKLIGLLAVLVCLPAILIIIIRYILIVIAVEGRSMYPTLNDGDRVLAVRFDVCPRWLRSLLRPERRLNRGRIVLVSPWLLPSANLKDLNATTVFIKRIIGVGGDTVVTSITDMDRELWPDHLAAHDSEGKRTWHIPPGHFFVLSDNLPGGYDSLTWGPVSYRTVLGIAIRNLSRRASLNENNSPPALRNHPGVQAGGVEQ
ncbi:MAG: signal peptidase I [Chloroflexia bacterium]